MKNCTAYIVYDGNKFPHQQGEDSPNDNETADASLRPISNERDVNKISPRPKSKRAGASPRAYDEVDSTEARLKQWRHVVAK